MNIPIGDKSPEIVNAVIEIPKGSHNKYEYDEDLKVIKLDRVLYSPLFYPNDYGFIPETRSEDGDHLDIMVMGNNPVFPGCVVAARPVGILKLIDDGDEDFKILAVQKDNPRHDHIKDMEDLKKTNPHLLDEVAHFFKVYKDLQKKEIKIIGWEGCEAAYGEIKRAQEMYKKES